MPKDQGQDYALYATTSEPSSGGKGDPTNYDLVGFATENSISIDRELIEAANKESGGDMEYVTGRRTPTIEGTFMLDVQDGNDTGQETLLDNIQDDTDSTVYFLLTDNVTGHTQFYGECLTESAEVTMPDQDMIELSATLQVQGGVTIQAAP
jgi:hypothetical protein